MLVFSPKKYFKRGSFCPPPWSTLSTPNLSGEIKKSSITNLKNILFGKVGLQHVFHRQLIRVHRGKVMLFIFKNSLNIEIINTMYRRIHEKDSGDVVSAVCYFIYTIYPSLCTQTADTADFIWKVLGVYTRSMEIIYLSLVYTGSWGYLFHEIPCTTSPEPFLWIPLYVVR